MEVCHEVLCPAGEELMGRGEAPGDAADVSIAVGGGTGDGQPGRVTTRYPCHLGSQVFSHLV